MKTYKVFLTMEFTADVQAANEDEARELLRRCVSCSEIRGCNGNGVYYAKNIKVKRYWGGGNEVDDAHKK